MGHGTTGYQEAALWGDSFQVRRAFAGIDLRYADPFLLLDHMGAGP